MSQKTHISLTLSYSENLYITFFYRNHNNDNHLFCMQLLKAIIGKLPHTGCFHIRCGRTCKTNKVTHVRFLSREEGSKKWAQGVALHLTAIEEMGFAMNRTVTAVLVILCIFLMITSSNEKTQTNPACLRHSTPGSLVATEDGNLEKV